MAYSLGELAGMLRCPFQGDPEQRIVGVQTLEDAGPEELSFLTNMRYRRQAEASGAGVLLVPEGTEMPGRDLLLSEQPYVILAKAVALFHPQLESRRGIHPTAVVESGALLDDSAWVAAGAVIDTGCVVESGAQIHPYVVLGHGCRVGRDSVLHPGVVLYPGVSVGERCIIHAGVVLGSDGFGFATQGAQHMKVPQVGSLVVENDVEIGANSTLDRGTLGQTRVGTGTKIDNLVHLAHNVKTGRGCFLVAQSGVAGSTKLGDFVVLAGQSGVAGHLEIGDGVQVAAKSAVFKSVPEGSVGGIPAIAASKWRRQVAHLSKLDDLKRRLQRLEQCLQEEDS